MLRVLCMRWWQHKAESFSSFQVSSFQVQVSKFEFLKFQNKSTQNKTKQIGCTGNPLDALPWLWYRTELVGYREAGFLMCFPTRLAFCPCFYSDARHHVRRQVAACGFKIWQLRSPLTRGCFAPTLARGEAPNKGQPRSQQQEKPVRVTYLRKRQRNCRTGQPQFA